MHAIYATLKKCIATLGMCLIVLSFGANSVWAQGSNNGGFDRVAMVSPSTGIDAVAAQPSQAALVSSYPNPFNPEATIRFDVSKSQQVRSERL